jgi:hypothetical protein
MNSQPSRASDGELHRWSGTGGQMIRHGDASELLGLLLISAVAAVIVIRLFLGLTGYPHVGGQGIHVAHMLWGGLSIFVALVAVLLFQGRRARRAAALLGGVGFGTFIDEVGKFMSASHNYFFRPALPLIYVGFVALYAIVHVLRRASPMTPREALANALFLHAETTGRPRDRQTIHRIRDLLDHADPDDPVADAILRSLPHTAGPFDPPGARRTWRKRIASAGSQLAGSRLGSWTLAAAPVLAVATASLVAWANISWGLAARGGPWTLLWLAQGASSVAGAALILAGLVALPRSREAARTWLQRGFLVWILVTQVFVFYTAQVLGVESLAVNLVAYGVIGMVLGPETTDSSRRLGAQARRHGSASRPVDPTAQPVS